MNDTPNRARTGADPLAPWSQVDTVRSDAHGCTLTLHTRNGLAAWHRERTAPEFQWMRGFPSRRRDAEAGQ